MSIAEKTTLTITQLVEKTLTIPDYQRPYKWQWESVENNIAKKGHVQKLLDDILQHQGKANGKSEFRYRIGTIVIHKDCKCENKEHEKECKNENCNFSLNIVDGQQRITTLALIMHALNEILENEKIDLANFLSGLNYDHKISQKNIHQNYKAIEGFIKDLKEKEDKKSFKKFLLENCEVVYIVLYSIDEAFQFFDSQNARGKSLEGYDLLKAFHLREMGEETIHKIDEKEKKELVKQWENAANDNFLSTIFNDLFAIRKWLRGENTSKNKRWDSGDFIKEDVDAFKGIVFDSKNYPYLKQYACPSKNFAIDREIFNGSLFFNYIQYYVEMYKEIFLPNEKFLKDLKKNDEATIENKDSKGEITNKKMSEIYQDGGTRFIFVTMLFKRVYLFYVDKFGYMELEKAIEVCFRWAGKLLGEKSRLFYSAIQGHAKQNNSLLKQIKYAEEHEQITKLKF